MTPLPPSTEDLVQPKIRDTSGFCVGLHLWLKVECEACIRVSDLDGHVLFTLPLAFQDHPADVLDLIYDQRMEAFLLGERRGKMARSRQIMALLSEGVEKSL